MPQLLERVLITRGRGRELPRIRAYNENHDELGRFAESGGEPTGGAPSKQSHVERFHAAKEAYQAAKENYKAVREQTFGAAQKAAKSELRFANASHNSLSAASDQVSSNSDSKDKPTASFSKAYEALDSHKSDYEENATISEKYAHFGKSVKLAEKAIEKLTVVVPVEGDSTRLSAKEIIDSRAKLQDVVMSAKAGRDAIRRAAGHAREAKAIRDGMGDIRAELVEDEFDV